MSWVLRAAGALNLLWGAWAILFPDAGFRLLQIAPLNYPEVWQGLGLVVAIYGIAYLAASTNPVVHWPVVLSGLIAKLLAPLGFAYAASNGRVPWDAGVAMLLTDVVWWVPFALILREAYNEHLGRLRGVSPEIVRFSLRTKTSHGKTIEELSRQKPVLLVFLRHAGCTFCREALADLAEQNKELHLAGAELVLVHMGTENHAQQFFAKYGLQHVPRINDPGRNLYRAFGLRRGRLLDLFGFKVWVRGFQAGILGGHGVGKLVGDGFQMPGVFLLYHGEVIRSFRHQSAADRPDYVRFVTEETLQPASMRG